MADPFIGQIQMFAFDFAPRGWALCDGQTIPILQNQKLFSLITTTYGGDGQTNFKLPDLRGRIPVHTSATAKPGVNGGVESLMLTHGQLPAHNHLVKASKLQADSTDGANRVLAKGRNPANGEDFPIYGAESNLVQMNNATLVPNGGDLPHNNMQPSLVISFCIALDGFFPSRP